MDEKYLSEIYQAGGGEGKLGKYEDFKTVIGDDEAYRTDFYDSMGGEKELGKYEDFSSLVSVKKKDSTAPTTTSSDSDTPSDVSGLGGQTTKPEPVEETDSAVSFRPSGVEAGPEKIPVESDTEPEPKKQSRASSFLGQVNRGFYGLPGDIAKSWGVAASWVDRNVVVPLLNKAEGEGSYVPGKTEDQPAFKIGEKYDEFIQDIAPTNPEFQGELQEQVGAAIGQLGSLVLTGGVTGVASKANLGQTTASAFKNLLSPTAIQGAVQMGISEFESAKQAGASDEDAFEVFIKNAAVGSILERLPIQSFFKRLDTATGGGVKKALIRGAFGGIEEGVTEAMQEVYSNYEAKNVYDETRDLLSGIGEAGGIGFGLGFVLNAMGVKLKNIKSETNSPEKIAEIEKAQKLVKDELDKNAPEITQETPNVAETVQKSQIDVEAQNPKSAIKEAGKILDKMEETGTEGDLEETTSELEKEIIKESDEELPPAVEESAKTVEKTAKAVQEPEKSVEKTEKPTEKSLTSDFEKIAKESKTVEEAFEKSKKIKGVSKEVAQAFKDEYDPEGKLTPEQAFTNFYNEVNKKTETQKESKPKSEPTDIYDNDAIKVKPKKRKANITPELSPEGKVYEGIGNEETVGEAQRIIKDNDTEQVEATARDKTNDMHPALRRALFLELAKEAKNNGDLDRATKLFDEYAELGGEGAQSVQFGSVAAKDPDVRTLEVIKEVREQNEKALEETTETGKTVKEDIDTSKATIKKIAAKEGVKVSESDTVEAAIEKIVQSRVGKAAKVTGGKDKVKAARAERKKLSKEFKDKKNDLFLSAAVPGLTPEGVKYVAKVAKTYIDEGIANIEILTEKVKAHLEKEFGKSVDEKIIKAAVQKSIKTPSSTKDALKGMGVDIKQLVKEHYSEKNAVSGDLKTKLIDQLGLSGKEAGDLAKTIEGEFQTLMTEQAQEELTKLYGTSKVPQKKKLNTETQKMIEAINMGAFDTDFYSALVADKFGISIISQEDVAKLIELSDQLQKMKPGELKNRKLRDFDDHMNSVKNPSRRQAIYNIILDTFYTSILSGMSTLERALKGASLTSTMNAITASMNNPVATFYGLRGFKHFLRGINSFGWNGFTQVLKDGYSDIDFFDRKVTGSGPLDLIINKSMKGHVADGEAYKAVVKAFLYLPTKMYRSLLASDAVLKTGIKEYEAYIIEYNKMIEAGGDRTNQKFYDQVNHNLALDPASVNKAEVEAALEVKALKESGEKVPLGYEKRRVMEMTEQNRDEETNKTAYFKSNEAVLMNDPVGQLGNIYRIMSNAGIIKEDDSKATMFRKFIFRTIFPFLRVPTNFINMNLDYTPYGVYRGYRGDVKTREGIVELSKEQRSRHYMKAALGSTIATGLMMAIFDWDEEEGFVLDPNSPIRITAAGTGNFGADKSIYKGYKQYSIRFENPFTGNWTKPYSYIDNPIGMMVAPIGFMSDEIMFKDFKKDIAGQGHLKQRRDLGYLASTSMYFATTFASSQSYSQGMKTLVDIIDSGNSDNEKYTEKVTKLMTNPVKAIMVPNLYRQLGQQYKALKGLPEKKAFTVPEKLIKGTPFAEAIIDGYDYDVLGYPIVRDFDFPLIPDIILHTIQKNVNERKERKEWQLLWKYPQVNIGPFKAPNYINKKRISNEEKKEYLEKVGLEFRKGVKKNYARLNRMNAIKLQKKLNKLRSAAIKKAKGEKMFKLDFELDLDLDFDF